MSVTICVTLLWHQCGCFSSAVLQTKEQSFKTNRWSESSVTLYETMIKDISKWIFAVVECIAQRLVNKEVLLTRVCGTWVEVRDKLDSSRLPREEGRPQLVGLLTICEKELDFLICFFPVVGYSLCTSIQTDVNSSYAAFSKIQNNFAFSQLGCIPGVNAPWTLPFSTFCYFTENLSLFYSCALLKPEWIGTSAKCEQKRKDEKLKIPECFHWSDLSHKLFLY